MSMAMLGRTYYYDIYSIVSDTYEAKKQSICNSSVSAGQYFPSDIDKLSDVPVTNINQLLTLNFALLHSV